MRITISGVGGLPLVVSHVKVLEENDLINISGLCRKLGVARSTFLDKATNIGFEGAIRFFLEQQRKKKLKE